MAGARRGGHIAELTAGQLVVSCAGMQVLIVWLVVLSRVADVLMRLLNLRSR